MADSAMWKIILSFSYNYPNTMYTYHIEANIFIATSRNFLMSTVTVPHAHLTEFGRLACQ